MAIVVMGVSGSGKSTVAAALARALGGVYIDADDLHPPENIAKMSSRTPLSDEDRMPWLAAVGAALAASMDRGELAVVACSALRRRYRDALREAAPDAVFVQLEGSPELLASRLASRPGHFMPPALLASQLATLEPLGPDERGGVVDVAASLDEIVVNARALV